MEVALAFKKANKRFSYFMAFHSVDPHQKVAQKISQNPGIPHGLSIDQIRDERAAFIRSRGACYLYDKDVSGGLFRASGEANCMSPGNGTSIHLANNLGYVKLIIIERKGVIPDKFSLV